MKKLDPHVYLFTMGHFSVDWAQGGIPALLPYFITACQLITSRLPALFFKPTFSLSSVTQPSSDTTPTHLQALAVVLSGRSRGMSLTTLALH